MTVTDRRLQSDATPDIHPSMHVGLQGFGAGKFRRTKYISIWWAGPAVGAHAKGAALGHGKEYGNFDIIVDHGEVV